MNLLPSQWIVIGSQIVMLAVAILGVIDLNYHTQLLDNPLTLTIIGILNVLGIHQAVNPTTPNSVLGKMNPSLFKNPDQSSDK